MNDYNVLKHYATIRKAVVSDVPDDIYLDELVLSTDEKEYILKGLPLLRNCLSSIYDSIIEYSSNPLLPHKERSEYKNNGEIMKERRDAAAYINNTLLSLHCIALNGVYNDATLSISKEYLSKTAIKRHKIKFQQIMFNHYLDFCRIEYLKNGELSNWKNCDSITLIFNEKELCFTLQHLVKSNVSTLYSQYGDFRVYSKSGQKENRSIRFPESVRLKALGAKKYGFYQTLCKKTRELLNIEQTGENPYQGDAVFRILCDYGDIAKYKNAYENTRIGIETKQDSLTVGLRLGFEAFNKLPEIIEKLSPNVRKAFLSIRQCQSPVCPHKCTSKRFAVFDEDIYPDKVLKPCQYHSATCNIESDNDINAIVLVFEHIVKYTKYRTT